MYFEEYCVNDMSLKSLLQEQRQDDLGYHAESNIDQTPHDLVASTVSGLIKCSCKTFHNKL